MAFMKTQGPAQPVQDEGQSARRLPAAAVAAGLLAFAAALLSGCASEGQPVGSLTAKASDPVGLVSGLPARGEAVCLVSVGEHPYIDLAVRRAIADRGYRVRLTAPGAPIDARACRFAVTVSAGRAPNPSELPKKISLDFRDFYTGETLRAGWTRDDAKPAYLRRTASDLSSSGLGAGRHAGNALIAGQYGDPDRIVQNLVDQLFPLSIRYHR